MMKFLILSFLILSNISHAQDSKMVEIEDRLKSFEVSNHVGLYLDHERTLGFTDVSDPDFGQFKLSDRLFPSFGNFSGVAWVKLVIKNSGNDVQDFILNLDTTVISADLYFVDEGQRIHLKSGRKYSGETEKKFSSRMNAFKLRLKQNQVQTYYLAITSELVYPLKLKVQTLENFYKSERFPTYMAGLYAGVMLIMVFYNLFIYTSTKDVAYLYYVGTVFFLQLLMFSPMISNAELFTLNAQFLGEYQLIVSRLIGSIFLIQFGRVFLKTAQFKKVDILLKSTVSAKIILLLCVPFMNLTNVNTLANVAILPAIVTLISCSGYLFSKGFRYARFYFIAWFPLLLAAGAIIIINSLKLAHLFPNLMLFLLMGAMIEVLLLSLALGDKINEMRKERYQAQKAHKAEILELNKSLEMKVDEQTRDIKSMLENVNLGLFTITQDMTIHKDYSSNLKSILNQERIKNQDVMSLVFSKCDVGADALDQLEAMLSCSLGEDSINFEANRNLLVKEMNYETEGEVKNLEIDWAPIVNKDDQVEKILVTIRDVSSLRLLQQESEKQKERLTIIGEILHTKPSDFKYLHEESFKICSQYNSVNEVSSSLIADLFIALHTLKGVSRGYRFIKLSNSIHNFEDYIVKVRDSGEFDEALYLRVFNEFYMTLKEYKEIYDFLSSRNDESLDSQQEESVLLDNLVFETLRCKSELASDLGKENPVLALDIQSHIRLRSEASDIVKNSLIHMLRNSLDHGIESTEARIKKGKKSMGTIEVAAALGVKNESVEIIYRDDGQGLNLTRIFKLALEKGLVSSEEELSDIQIANFIFHEGFSTASETTIFSGRGVGMQAVKSFIEKQNGSIAIVPLEGTIDGLMPFEFKLSLPLSSVDDGAAKFVANG